MLGRSASEAAGSVRDENTLTLTLELIGHERKNPERVPNINLLSTSLSCKRLIKMNFCFKYSCYKDWQSEYHYR